MFKSNVNFGQLTESYLFSNIAKRVRDFIQTNPDAQIIRLGIGDVTLPLSSVVVDELIKASAEQGIADTFVGYGPEQGHDFLIERIIKHDYVSRGINLDCDEVFISDGAKSDLGNIGDILSSDNLVAITDPVYPVYRDTNIMTGRKIMLLPCYASNNFIPELPHDGVPDIIYLCYPNNPTGASLTRDQLKMWVDYAIKHRSMILFDSAYEAYIQQDDVPHSIYEIDGAMECAIEFRSFSKTAGFTGLRCGYTVVPRKLVDSDGTQLNNLWRRRQCTKFNGASYVVQRAAGALYTSAGADEVKRNISYYMTNARLLVQGLIDSGLEVYGGIDAPYVWVKSPDDMDSWSFFNMLLSKCHIVATPGVGFGACGESFVRFSAFCSHSDAMEAANRIKLIN